MPPSRWLCISTRVNDKITQKKHVWGVATRFTNTIARVKKGDTLIMYTMQEIVEKEILPSAITGIYEAVSDVYEDDTIIFTPYARSSTVELFPSRINLKPIKIFKKSITFKSLVPEMSFIKNKIMWAGSLRTAMRVIPEEDYQRIIKNAK